MPEVGGDRGSLDEAWHAEAMNRGNARASKAMMGSCYYGFARDVDA